MSLRLSPNHVSLHSPIHSLYSLTCLFRTKAVTGQMGFIAQLNEGRASKKRPTEFSVDKVS